MELRQLEHFLAVVKEGSFTAAARQLFMVQSSLSASLLALERELGSELFIRGKRGAELTDAGRHLLTPARTALQALQDARDAVAEVNGLNQGTVHLAYMPESVPRSIDPGRAIERFCAEHPGIDVRVTPADSRSMVAMVADGEVDFAITPATAGMGPRLSFHPLMRTELAIVCPAEHPLAGARHVDPGDFLGELIVDLPRTWESRALFDGILERNALARRASVEVDSWHGAVTMVQRGTGITYGPRQSIEDGFYPGLAIATLAGAPEWMYGVVTRDEALRGAAGRAFLAAYLDTRVTAGSPEHLGRGKRDGDGTRAA